MPDRLCSGFSDFAGHAAMALRGAAAHARERIACTTTSSNGCSPLGWTCRTASLAPALLGMGDLNPCRASVMAGPLTVCERTRVTAYGVPCGIRPKFPLVW